jgi:hypothetical protein
MSIHKFKVGQAVEYTGRFNIKSERLSFKVNQCLPERDGEPQYKIRSASESHERVVRESEIR